ncbi:MAG: branched-chain amino acid ABC transporter permease [Betaproteobacteria bacterium]|nr:MAG: branched-chain amino acid ABC transporter permease [Betaproteobacteria bacterium]
MSYFIDLVIVGLSLGMVYGLVAIGISLIYSGLDVVHFAHGEIYMLGAFIGLWVFNTFGLPFPLVLLASMIITGLIGVVIERVFYRPILKSGGGYTVAGMAMVICGFGMAFVLQNIAFLIWGPRSLPFPVTFGMPIEIGNLTLPSSYVWIVAAALVLMSALHLFLKKTRLGLAVRAVAGNKDIAYLMGINVPLTISVTFGVACALGAAAGVLVGPINYVHVLMGLGILIKAFAAAVIGGFGSLPGAVLGGLLVGVVESLGAGYLSGNYKDIYAFILLIVVLMIRPAGLFGILAKVKA